VSVVDSRDHGDRSSSTDGPVQMLVDECLDLLVGPLGIYKVNRAKVPLTSMNLVEKSPLYGSHLLVDDLRQLTLGDSVAEVDDCGENDVPEEFCPFRCTSKCVREFGVELHQDV
jgi:hypothetical protein